MVPHAYNTSFLGGGGRRISSLRAVPEKLVRLYLGNKKTNKRSGSSGRVWRVQGSGLSPQYCQKWGNISRFLRKEK
jgi:hypothetical protein